MKYHKSNREILAELDTLVYGHTEAKKALISLVARGKLRHNQVYIQKLAEEYLVKPSKLLLIGGSGTGKTHLIESLRKVVEFPLLKIDATELTITSASGGIKAHDLKKMIDKAAADYLATRPKTCHSYEGAKLQMVVFVDEIDKLGNNFDSSGNWNSHVQSNFLTLIDDKEGEFRDISWVFAGAFNALTKKNTSTRGSLGFSGEAPDKGPTKITDESVIQQGLIPELVGRISSIVALDNFTEEEYYNILINTLVPAKNVELSHFNIYEDKEVLSEETLRELSTSAAKSNQGVRFLIRELNKLYIDLEFDYEERPEIERLEYNSIGL